MQRNCKLENINYIIIEKIQKEVIDTYRGFVDELNIMLVIIGSVILGNFLLSLTELSMSVHFPPKNIGEFVGDSLSIILFLVIILISYYMINAMRETDIVSIYCNDKRIFCIKNKNIHTKELKLYCKYINDHCILLRIKIKKLFSSIKTAPYWHEGRLYEKLYNVLIEFDKTVQVKITEC